MFKKILIGLLILVIIIIASIMWSNKNIEAPTILDNTNTATQTKEDTSTSINAELNNIDINTGIDSEIESIDSSIKTL